ncbi:MAG: hypothetical protein C0617_00220 [Desulfuromonas sp.]|uniref:hypothetical protein n=1 Tax=Desulfuromonas sp. TaxID=892 RepID=UPI000CB91ACC|nr:hypothetical protein [Desulfuromonas sp.]PLX86671.1 MAG: hypothetical protein C0617_00220 [Desulfuromonas sp.]
MEAFDPQMCSQCRGLCCQSHPGVWADPHRFASIFFGGERVVLERLRRELPELGLTLRDYSGVPVPAPQPGPGGCSLLSEQGCSLSPEQRPCQCLALIPSIETLLDGEVRCHLPGPYTYGAVRERWRAYWAVSA